MDFLKVVLLTMCALAVCDGFLWGRRRKVDQSCNCHCGKKLPGTLDVGEEKPSLRDTIPAGDDTMWDEYAEAKKLENQDIVNEVRDEVDDNSEPYVDENGLYVREPYEGKK